MSSAAEPDQPCHHALGHRAEMPDPPPTGVIGLPRRDHVGGDRVELFPCDLARAEARHEIRTQPHRLGDLHRGRLLERRHGGAGNHAADGGDRVAARARLQERGPSRADRASPAYPPAGFAGHPGIRCSRPALSGRGGRTRACPAPARRRAPPAACAPSRARSRPRARRPHVATAPHRGCRARQTRDTSCSSAHRAPCRARCRAQPCHLPPPPPCHPQKRTSAQPRSAAPPRQPPHAGSRRPPAPAQPDPLARQAGEGEDGHPGAHEREPQAGGRCEREHCQPGHERRRGRTAVGDRAHRPRQRGRQTSAAPMAAASAADTARGTAAHHTGAAQMARTTAFSAKSRAQARGATPGLTPPPRGHRAAERTT